MGRGGGGGEEEALAGRRRVLSLEDRCARRHRRPPHSARGRGVRAVAAVERVCGPEAEAVIALGEDPRRLLRDGAVVVEPHLRDALTSAPSSASPLREG